MNKYNIGDTVIPLSKTYPGYRPLEESSMWKRAQEKNQNFIYIVRIISGGYECSEDKSKTYGDYFTESDLIKAYTIEDLQNFPSDIWIHCTTAEQMAKLGKYYYGPEMKDYKDRLAWVDMTTALKEEGGEAGCYIGKGRYCGGWNPWSVAKDEKYTIEFNQVIFPKEDNMNKKIIGYKLLKDLPDLKAGVIFIPTTAGERESGACDWIYTWTNSRQQDNELSYYDIDIKDNTSWFKPIYESTKKTFIIECATDPLTITIEGSKVISEGVEINIARWEQLLTWKYNINDWNIKPSHLDVGCRKAIPVAELQKVIDYYYSINK